MDYKVLAKASLSEYCVTAAALENLQSRIAEIQTRLAVRPPQGEGAEEERLSLIAEREHLRDILDFRMEGFSRIRRGLEALTREQRRVLEKFYINRTDSYIDDLMDELGYERRKIYYMHSEALRDFAIAMYGISED